RQSRASARSIVDRRHVRRDATGVLVYRHRGTRTRGALSCAVTRSAALLGESLAPLVASLASAVAVVTRPAVRDPEAELAAAAARPGAARPRTRLDPRAARPLDLAAGLLALRDADPGLDLGRPALLGSLAHLAARGLRGDQREVDPAAHHRDVVDLDGHLVAQLECRAGPLAGQSHVDLIVAELVAERVELDQALDERLLDLDERA